VKTCIKTWTILTCLMASPVFAHANAALEHVLGKLAEKAPADQVARLREAIASSPSLEAQLNALATSGELTQFAVGNEVTLPPKVGPFSAWIHGTTWAFHADFIGHHGKTRLYDVVRPGDILPDNLVFALGHLAYKAKTAKAMDVGSASAKALSLQQWVVLRMTNDAEATIQAWNDTVDAAEEENGGAHLTVAQQASMLINLQYRGALLKAMQAPEEGKLVVARDGRIEMTAANVAAVTKALSTSTVFDVQ